MGEGQNDRLNRPDEIALTNPIKANQLASTAIVESDWRKIIDRLVSLSPHAIIEGETEKGNGWRPSNIARLVLKHHLRGQVTENERSEENLDKIRDCLARISERDYLGAAESYRTFHGWFEPEEVRQCEKEIENVFNSVEATGRRFCIMLVLRFRMIERRSAQILIDFVRQTLNSILPIPVPNPHENSEEQTARLQDISLLTRVIIPLSEHQFSTYEDVRFLLQCLESNLPEVVDFAMSSIEKLKGLENDALRHCDKLLKSSEPSNLWAGVLLSSSARASEASFIERMLPQLYDKELIFRDKSVADHTAYSMLKILSNDVTASAFHKS